jgi:hypothetical protein
LRRPFSWARASHWLLALAALPLFCAFAWQPGLATIGDDSVSYLLIARWLSGNVDTLLAPLVAWHMHFPPLFPAALALAGGGLDPATAHLVVAAFAALSVAFIGRYAALRLDSEVAGLAVAAAFLMLPTAWISVKGILSESMYLALTMAALHFHDARPEGSWRARDTLLFGMLLAAVLFTRSAGVAFLAAYVMRTAVRAVRDRNIDLRGWLALLPPVVLALSWAAIRPGGQEAYGLALTRTLSTWLTDPAGALAVAGVAFSDGWFATFAADSGVQGAPRALVTVLGFVAFAGTFRAIASNRLDGWYVLGATILLFVLPYGGNNTRRMLYPLVPLLIVHAAEALAAFAAWLQLRRPGWIAAAALALPILPSGAAVALVAEKATHDVPLVAGSRYTARELIDYYTTVNLAQARAQAARQAAVLGGLERLVTDTPPAAQVMWMRPEYVALLGKRGGAPSYFEWDARRLAREIRDARIDYLVISGVFKSDLRQNAGDPAITLRDAAAYTSPHTVLANPFTGQDEFILLKVDRAMLDAWLAAPG